MPTESNLPDSVIQLRNALITGDIRILDYDEESIERLCQEIYDGEGQMPIMQWRWLQLVDYLLEQEERDEVS